MASKFALCSALIALTSTALFADFQYQEKTEITGGAMASMLRMASRFNKRAGEPVVDTVIFHGDRMARIGPHTGQIIDLDKETITSIDFDRKTYSVMTFAQMKQMMDDMRARLNQAQKDNPNIETKVSVRDTGRTKQIDGTNAEDYVMTVTFAGTDSSGQSGNMSITADRWMGPAIPGYDEARHFQARMAEKLGLAMGGQYQGMMMSHPDAMKGLADAAREAAKMKGVPMLVVTRIGSTADGQPLPPASEAPLPQEKEQSKGDGAAGVLGRLGGFGGFGHGRHHDQEQQQPQSGPAVLMESTMEYSGFSAAPADLSKFDVPAGFKEVAPRTEPRRAR
jgi:hypothetical protein